MKVLLAFILAVVSPIWPIGENPLPGDPFIIVNKKYNKLAFVLDEKIEVYPIASGKTDDLTPEGLFTVTVKAINPYYRKLNIPGGHPKNPLGSRWIGFDALDTIGRTYGIHGTNRPESIGRYVSNGCIRMRKEDVEALFDQVPIGTKVWVVSNYKSFYDLAVEAGAIMDESQKLKWPLVMNW
ncbi:L,D-transpeptidase-like protein [Bacillus oleivorans]|uniref:L,D-transpeptidase-like protein n=1 Tax=Bacillus oleivorans TaxID=1448271 RepID=A0A285CLV5_9BACI|nr:L,D-transpeptidase [Bacillus oleivorans]SNX68003.1 L,D-transpeptidase-like protein [Bacillus oleivorans]